MKKAWPAMLLALVLNAVSGPAFALDPRLNITQYGHTVWRTRDGAFTGSVTAITQTRDGYIWIATSTGLLRFDGVRFEPWRPPEGTSLTSVVGLLGSRDGSLWIGTSTGLLRWKDRSLTILASAGYFASILEDRSGTIWAGHTRSGPGPLCRFTNAQFSCIGPSNGLPLHWVEVLYQDVHGDLWIGGDGGICRRRDDSYECRPIPGLVQVDGKFGVQAIASDANGSLWASAGPMGIWRWESTQWVRDKAADAATQSETMLRDGQAGLWIGSVQHGLVRPTPTRVDRFTTADGLSGDRVNALFEDSEGNVWAATNGGLDRFRDVSVVTITNREGLFADRVTSVASSATGAIWITSSTGDLLRMSGDTSARVTAADGLPPGQPTSLFEDSHGRLWIGINDGLFWMDAAGRFTPVRLPDRLPVGLVRGITEDTHADIWVAATRQEHALIRIRDLDVVEMMGTDRFGGATVGAMAADPAGGLWLGLTSSRRLLHYDDRTSNVSEVARDIPLSKLIVDSHGVWLTTPRGIRLVKDRRISELTTRNGLPCDGWSAIVKTHDDALWIKGACGIVHLAAADVRQWVADPQRAIRFRWYDSFDGAQSDVDGVFQSQAAESGDGRVWFAVARVGVQIVDPSRLSEVHRPVPVYITNVTADRRAYDGAADAHLPPLTRDLEIDYTALSFRAPEKIRFRYRLDGFDPDWQDADGRRSAFYTNLRPGSYTFRVMASTRDGVWTDAAATTTLAIAAAFYQTKLFVVACGLASLTVLYMFYAVRVRRVAVVVRGRMEERLAERERIARELHDTLLQSTYGLLLRFQAIADQPTTAPSVRELMEHALDSGDQAIAEARNRVEDLRSGSAAGHDLGAALQSIATEMTAGDSPAIRVNVSAQRRSLNPLVGDEVFWIAREALFNACRAAHAEQIDVTLAYGRPELRLTIRDDGRGIDEAVLHSGGIPKHWGIRGMRERAARVGGRLNITSRLNSGTTVELHIPAGLAYAPDPGTSSSWFRRNAVK